jgi:hypothetical protein
MDYNCILCDYSSNSNYNLERHLNTKKHIENEKNYDDTYGKVPIALKKRPEKTQNSQNEQKKRPEKTRKRPAKDSAETQKIECEYCSQEFKNKTHLYRHIKYRCKIVKETNEQNKEMVLFMDHHQKEREALKAHISQLLEIQASTINNTDNSKNSHNTNNIQINNYGSEDLSHITDAYKTELIKGPFAMIQRLIEKIYFNDDKPENRNIILPNKNDTMVKVMKDGEWKYCDRDSSMMDVIDSCYFSLDNHYEKIKYLNDLLNYYQDKNYKKFQQLYDDKDKDTLNYLKKECKMLFLNNR